MRDQIKEATHYTVTFQNLLSCLQNHIHVKTTCNKNLY